MNSLINYIKKNIPEFQSRIDEHLEDNYGEVLLHPLMGEFTRFLIDAYKENNTELFERCISLIEMMISSTDEKLSELASVSILENLHQADQVYDDIKKSLKTNSLKQIQIIEGESI